MKAGIVVFPGSNREVDAAHALTLITGKAPRLIWHGETDPLDLDLIVLPGGFAHGDYLRTGAIAAHSPVMTEVRRAAERGVHVLGMCNGFQVLVESGLLPGVLLRNASLKFVCRDVLLRVETSNSPFTRAYNAGDVIRVPVAHGEGNYFTDPETLKRLEDEDRIPVRYCAEDGSLTDDANPNGSLKNIAGVLSENRRVFGLMPHPENAVEAAIGGTDGCALFQSLAKVLA
ncbi:MAG: phosphoribosylformylglycinamidine synthase subunit PurQ [Elsteraceae bacterium]